jgi:hypothetical protein
MKIGFAFSMTWIAFVVGFTVLGWLISHGDPVLLAHLVIP